MEPDIVRETQECVPGFGETDPGDTTINENSLQSNHFTVLYDTDTVLIHRVTSCHQAKPLNTPKPSGTTESGYLRN